MPQTGRTTTWARRTIGSSSPTSPVNSTAWVWPLHIVDGLAFGFHNLGEPMTLAEFRNIFHGPLIGNCGYTNETAEKAIAKGHADLISFGRPFISNPDLVERFRNDWPLAELAPMADWYSPTGGKGYTDFPAYEPLSARS